MVCRYWKFLYLHGKLGIFTSLVSYLPTFQVEFFTLVLLNPTYLPYQMSYSFINESFILSISISVEHATPISLPVTSARLFWRLCSFLFLTRPYKYLCYSFKNIRSIISHSCRFLDYKLFKNNCPVNWKKLL